MIFKIETTEYFDMPMAFTITRTFDLLWIFSFPSGNWVPVIFIKLVFDEVFFSQKKAWLGHEIQFFYFHQYSHDCQFSITLKHKLNDTIWSKFDSSLRSDSGWRKHFSLTDGRWRGQYFFSSTARIPKRN